MRSYDGDVSGEDEDAEVVPDEEDGTQIETSKSTEDKTLQDNEGKEETNKEDGNQTAKSGDKKPVQKCSNWALSRSRDGPVSYDKDILAKSQRTKYSKDHISIH